MRGSLIRRFYKSAAEVSLCTSLATGISCSDGPLLGIMRPAPQKNRAAKRDISLARESLEHRDPVRFQGSREAGIHVAGRVDVPRQGLIASPRRRPQNLDRFADGHVGMEHAKFDEDSPGRDGRQRGWPGLLSRRQQFRPFGGLRLLWRQGSTFFGD